MNKLFYSIRMTYNLQFILNRFYSEMMTNINNKLKKNSKQIKKFPHNLNRFSKTSVLYLHIENKALELGRESEG